MALPALVIGAAVAQHEEEPVRRAGAEGGRRRVDQGGVVGAALRHELGIEGRQELAEDLIVGAERRLQEGRAGKHHEPHPLAAQAVEEGLDQQLGAVQARGLDVRGEHRAGKVERQQDPRGTGRRPARRSGPTAGGRAPRSRVRARRPATSGPGRGRARRRWRSAAGCAARPRRAGSWDGPPPAARLRRVHSHAARPAGRRRRQSSWARRRSWARGGGEVRGGRPRRPGGGRRGCRARRRGAAGRRPGQPGEELGRQQVALCLEFDLLRAVDVAEGRLDRPGFRGAEELAARLLGNLAQGVLVEVGQDVPVADLVAPGRRRSGRARCRPCPRRSCRSGCRGTARWRRPASAPGCRGCWPRRSGAR